MSVLTTVVTNHAARLLLAVSTPTITPNNSLPGTAALQNVVGGIETWSILGCMAGIVIGAVAWAWAKHAGNMSVSSNGRSMVFFAVIALAVIGSLTVITTFALGISLSAG
jgi:hypothetical protein